MKQLKQILAIGSTTAREMLRNPAFSVLMLFGVIATVLSPVFSMFHLGQHVKMVTDLGLGSVLIVSLLVGVLGASWAIYEELQSQSVLALLSKPISRGTFLLGKYFGVLIAVFVSMVVLGVTLFLTVVATELPLSLSLISFALLLFFTALGSWLLKKQGLGLVKAIFAALGLTLLAFFVVMAKSGPLASFDRAIPGWRVDILTALLGIFLQIAILVAIASALATRISFTSNLTIVLAVFVLGQLVSNIDPSGIMWLVSALVPDLLVFHFADVVASNISASAALFSVPAGIILQAGLTAIAYIAGALLIGWASLNTRDLQ